MAYPTFFINVGGTLKLDSGRTVERATNGSAIGRSFFASPKAAFKFSHWLSDADLTTFMSFYTTNSYGTFSFTWPGTGATYTVMFSAEPKQKPMGGGFTEVDVELQEV